MKKARWIAFCLVLLSALMLFSACGQPKTKFQKALDGEKFSNPIPAAGAAVDALKDTAFVHSSGALALFSKVGDDGSTSHLVYNLETNTVVYTGASTAEQTLSIELSRVENYGAVISTLTQAVDSYSEQKPHRALYTEAGVLIAEADAVDAPEIACDPIHFDNKIYRMAEDGTVAFAFDWSPLSTFPEIEQKLGDFYLAEGDDSVIFYSTDLKYVSTLEIPAYAENLEGVVLSSGKMLIQYAVAEPEDAEKYTFIAPDSQYGSTLGYVAGTKYTLKTMLYTPKNDKCKEIDFDRLIRASISRVTDQRQWDEATLSDDYDAMLITYTITDKMVDTSSTSMQYNLVKKNGKISTLELAALGDAQLTYWEALGNNLWAVATESAGYLMNEKGKIVGEVGNANMIGGYLAADGKLYNYNMELVLDYKAAELTKLESYDGCILFENKVDELICFANGTQTTLIAKDSKRMLYHHDPYDGFFVICDYSAGGTPRFELYNENGVKLLDLTEIGTTPVFQRMMTGDNGELLISCVNSEELVVYYRLG